MPPSSTCKFEPPQNIPKSEVFRIFASDTPADRPKNARPLVEGFYIESDTFNDTAKEKDSLYLWGCLVKSWATGINHFPGQAPGAPYLAQTGNRC